MVTEDEGPSEPTTPSVETRFGSWTLPLAYLLGGIVFFVSDDGQRLGDFAADTVVARVVTD